MARVMVLDNDHLVRWSLRSALERDGHEVFCAADGRRAIEVARGTTFDVLITDLDMPGMDGLQVIDCLHRTSPATRIMVVSASADWDRQTLLARGAYEIITKPFAVDKIRSLVQTAVTAKAAL